MSSPRERTHVSREAISASSGSLPAARQNSLWLLGSLAVVGLLVAVSTWAHGAIEATVRDQVGRGIHTLLEARTAAIESWIEDQLRLARAEASSQDLVEPLLQWLDQPDEAARARVTHVLADHRKRFDLERLAVFDASGDRVAPDGPDSESLDRDLVEHVFSGAPLVVPLLQPRDARGPEGRIVGMAVPIVDPRGEPRAVLGLGLSPDRFAPLIGTPTDDLTETLVFDEEGRLLSGSVYEEELVGAGLLVEGQGAALQLLLRDPGGNLLEDHGLPGSEPRTWPATRMAAEATSGRPGMDLDGYRNVLGVEVVGAWHWFEDHRFGVAVEVEKERAFAPLGPLGIVCWLLVTLLLALGGGILGVTWNARRIGRLMAAAERRADRLGQYTLEEKIGEGGMSEVYRAHHVLLRRPTALKLLRTDRHGRAAIERFQREVRETSRLSHPNTISIYDYGHTSDGTFFYAMELITGLTLAELVAKEGPLSEGRAIYLLSQVCGSLEEAHALGLVHRDVKPSNVLVCARAGLYDLVKVLDFGLVKDLESDELELTRAGTLTGTPQYISPEAVRDPAGVDARSDIYAVGCVAYYLLTGRPVFRVESLAGILAAHLEDRPDPPSQHRGVPLDPVLEQLVLDCLAKDPEQRPATAGELVRRLSSCAATGSWGPVEARDWWAGRGSEEVAIDPMPSPTPGSAPPLAVGIEVVAEDEVTKEGPTP